MRQLKFRAYHPKFGMKDFGIDKFSLETIETKVKRVELPNGISMVDPESLQAPKLYLRRGLDLDYKPNPNQFPPPPLMLMNVVDLEDPDLKIMQYLGEYCKDKNGNFICEEDIVKDKRGNIYKIYYHFTASFCLYGKEDEIIIFWNDYEIIGNIYENPELLPQENI